MQILFSPAHQLKGDKMSENVIDITGLKKDFDNVQAVKGIDLQVKRGEIFGLLGPDGAGKTTTIRMLVGIMEPTGGFGTVLGCDFIRERENVKRHIGYMSQRFSLYGDLTVAENIEYFSEVYEIPIEEKAARKERMLDFSRLHPFVDRLSQDLSGGMKQKLALACTLMHDPDLLFLDEPTTGVDPVSRRDFWKILYQLVAEGMTIVVSTPYMDEAERCNRIAMMDEGRILKLDTPANLKRGMVGSLLEIFAEPQNAARNLLHTIAVLDNIQVFGDKLHATTADIKTAISEIRRVFDSADIRLNDVHEAVPGLEDVFVTTIQKEHGENYG